MHVWVLWWCCIIIIKKNWRNPRKSPRPMARNCWTLDWENPPRELELSPLAAWRYTNLLRLVISCSKRTLNAEFLHWNEPIMKFCYKNGPGEESYCWNRPRAFVQIAWPQEYLAKYSNKWFFHWSLNNSRAVIIYLVKFIRMTPFVTWIILTEQWSTHE